MKITFSTKKTNKLSIPKYFYSTLCALSIVYDTNLRIGNWYEVIFNVIRGLLKKHIMAAYKFCFQEGLLKAFFGLFKKRLSLKLLLNVFFTSVIIFRALFLMMINLHDLKKIRLSFSQYMNFNTSFRFSSAIHIFL